MSELTEQTELLREMRDLLRLIAEPALAKRDTALRTSLLEIVGRSKSKVKAVLLMDGSRSQADIRKESGIDQADLSRLVTALRTKGLTTAGTRDPKLTIPVSLDLFEKLEGRNG